MFKPAVITVTQGTPEWDALVQALDQFTENTRCFVDDEEPEDYPQEREHLKYADAVLDRMNLALVALVDADDCACAGTIERDVHGSECYDLCISHAGERADECRWCS
jgi:hypothetical protein